MAMDFAWNFISTSKCYSSKTLQNTFWTNNSKKLWFTTILNLVCFYHNLYDIFIIFVNKYIEYTHIEYSL